jgi:hypothetical protein
MAEFQWWLLIVGIVAGGGLVLVVYMDTRRREEDVDLQEMEAEATWIAARLSTDPGAPSPETVEAVLRTHREYLHLPPPDHLEVIGGADETATPAGLAEPVAAPDPGGPAEDRAVEGP